MHLHGSDILQAGQGKHFPHTHGEGALTNSYQRLRMLWEAHAFSQRCVCCNNITFDQNSQTLHVLTVSYVTR